MHIALIASVTAAYGLTGLAAVADARTPPVEPQRLIQPQPEFDSSSPREAPVARPPVDVAQVACGDSGFVCPEGYFCCVSPLGEYYCAPAGGSC